MVWKMLSKHQATMCYSTYFYSPAFCIVVHFKNMIQTRRVYISHCCEYNRTVRRLTHTHARTAQHIRLNTARVVVIHMNDEYEWEKLPAVNQTYTYISIILPLPLQYEPSILREYQLFSFFLNMKYNAVNVSYISVCVATVRGRLNGYAILNYATYSVFVLV